MPTQTREATSLPMMSVARVKEATLLIERMVAEKTSVFVQKSQEYREVQREGSKRPITAQEAAHIAAAMADVMGDEDVDRGQAVREMQDAGVTTHDEPAPQEVLMAAGLSTAPALLDAALRLVALVELDKETFDSAREDETLDEEVKEYAERVLEPLDLKVARERATAALYHVTSAAGTEPGEAWGLLSRIIGQAFGQAIQAAPTLADSISSFSTGSPASTAGDGEQSSTTPPSETQ